MKFRIRRSRNVSLPTSVSPDGPHAIRDGYFNPSLGKVDQTAGFVQWLKDGANAACYYDGPGAWYVDATAAIAAPVCETLVIRGINERRGVAYLQGGSRIIPINDLPLGAAPKVTPLIDLRPVSRVSWDGITVVQPKVRYTTKGGGIIPSVIGGLGLAGSHHVQHTSMGGLSADFILGRGGTNPTGYDHADFYDVYTDSSAVSVHYLPGANAAGDDGFDECDFGGSQASFWMAHSSSSGLVGDNFRRVGGYAPIMFAVYDDGTTAAGGQLGSDVLSGVSAEFAYTAVYYDQRYKQVGGSFVGGNVWTPGFYQSPSADLLGWGQDCTVVSCSGSTMVVTPPAGYEFQYGMIVVDPSVDPLGASPLATLTTPPAETWPYSTDNKTFQATLTLDKALSLAPGKVVHIMQPKLGTIVAGSIAMEHVQGGLMRNPTGKPVFYAGRSNVHDVNIEDWGSAKALEAVAPVFGGNVGTGNFAGYEGSSVRLGFGVMGSGQSAGHGDFVCGANVLNLRKYDGTEPPRGTVIRNAGVTAGGSFGFQRKASDRNTTAPCFNHDPVNSIPANSFVKPDPATGGVLPCAESDPARIGLNGSTVIGPNSAGTLVALWCDKQA